MLSYKSFLIMYYNIILYVGIFNRQICVELATVIEYVLILKSDGQTNNHEMWQILYKARILLLQL